VIWKAYQAENAPVAKEVFREAYIHGERTLGKNPIIKPHHTFLDMMRLKIDIQMEWLHFHQPLQRRSVWTNRIADYCYNYARLSIERAFTILEQLASRYPMALVSNFYGNIATVLQDFGIDRFFPVIIESAVVGVRKPDPQIFRLGVEALQLKADEVVVIGDSYEKDIIPAQAAGCQTVWLKNTGWNAFSGTESADLIISTFADLIKIC
jgi:putative hydrolase of the HAD superfamily